MPSQTNGYRCALCNRPVRSSYSLAGEHDVRFCAACFFKPVPTIEAPR